MGKINKINKKTNKLILILIMIISLFTTGFTTTKFTPRTLYRVYLGGKSLGLIESKKSLEQYIDKKQDEIKKKYNVEKVYVPDELDIEKEITYSNKVLSIQEIYKKIKDTSPFTIDGYKITIKGIDTKDSEGKTIKGKKQYIYVLDKNIFKTATEKTVKSFINEETLELYATNKQKKITDVGTIVENIYKK